MGEHRNLTALRDVVATRRCIDSFGILLEMIIFIPGDSANGFFIIRQKDIYRLLSELIPSPVSHPSPSIQVAYTSSSIQVAYPSPSSVYPSTSFPKMIFQSRPKSP